MRMCKNAHILTHTHTHAHKLTHTHTHTHTVPTIMPSLPCTYPQLTLYTNPHTQRHMHTHCILQKERNNKKKYCASLFDKKKMQRTFMVCFWICAVKVLLFAKHTTILANAPQFGETRRIFTEKVPQSLEKSNNPWIAVLYKTVYFQE